MYNNSHRNNFILGIGALFKLTGQSLKGKFGEMPTRSRHCNRGVYVNHTSLIFGLGRHAYDEESGARRPAYSNSTAKPTGDREVLDDPA